MRGFAEAPGAVTVLAEAQGKLAGFCIAQLEDSTGMWSRSMWLPHGVGVAWRGVSWLKSSPGSTPPAPCRCSCMSSPATRQPSAFYESIGYTHVGRGRKLLRAKPARAPLP